MLLSCTPCIHDDMKKKEFYELLAWRENPSLILRFNHALAVVATLPGTYVSEHFCRAVGPGAYICISAEL